jgi:stage II sporulation protein E
MMKSVIIPYKKIEHETTYENTSRVKNISFVTYILKLLTIRNLLLTTIAFFLGRASFGEGLMPFGPAFYMAACGKGINGILVALFVVAGLISGGSGGHIYKGIIAILIFNAIRKIIKSKKMEKGYHQIAVAFFSMFLPEIIMTSLQGFLMYDFLKSFLSAFAVMLFYIIFEKSISVLEKSPWRKTLSLEGIISMTVMIAVAVSGLNNVKVLNITPGNVFCIIMILISGYKLGPGAGAAIGAAIGTVMCILNPVSPVIIGTYAFCGMLSGLLKNSGKIGSSIGLVAGNAILTIYLSGTSQVLIQIKEVIIAVGIFLITPETLLNKVSDVFYNNRTDRNRNSYLSCIRELTVKKLEAFSNTFKNLSITFAEISRSTVVTDRHDISSLFDRVADKVCSDCSLFHYCWDINFYDTYQTIFKILEKLDSKGHIDKKDIPKVFVEKCERLETFINTINSIYELFKADIVWKNRINETREVVSQQLEGLSTIVSSLASEIDKDIHFKSELEKLVVKELQDAGINIEDCTIFENKNNKIEVIIYYKSCNMNRNVTEFAETVTTKVTGKKMKLYNKSMGYLKLKEEEPLRVVTGIAGIPKNNGKVSGDSYTFMNNGYGKFIAVLSDGMGTGDKAAIQSRAAINLLEQFMEAGFDKDTAVKIINSVLVLKSNEDSFTTIDISTIDLYNGEVEFIKIGAVPTFIKSNDSVDMIKAVSIPVGILGNLKAELLHRRVESGNFIVMMTDGVYDAFKEDDKKEKSIYSLIKSIKSINPQQIADLILSKAFDNYGKMPEDDMMVMVAKVWKTA